MRFFLTVLLLAISLRAAEFSIPLAATHSSEADGDGYAFHIPNLDGTTVNSDGSVNYNPLTYPPLPFDPVSPSTPLPAGTPFSFGSITYNDSSLTRSGTETLALTPAMIRFDFSAYDHAFGYELDVRPPTAGKSLVTLENIQGPGLRFVDGVPVSLDITASVVWWPTLYGALKQTYTPYRGKLTVSNGTFTFDLSDVPARWVLGTSDVYFTFDLIVTVPSLHVPPSPALPRLAIVHIPAGHVTLTPVFPAPSAERFVLQSADHPSAPNWTDLGSDFDSSSAQPLVVPLTSSPRFFRLRTLNP